MKHLLLLLLSVACIAADYIDPESVNEGFRSMIVSPANNETGVSRTVTVKLRLLNNSMEICPPVSMEDVYAKFADVECVSDSIYDEEQTTLYYDADKFTVSLGCDTLKIQRVAALSPYTRYTVFCQWTWVFNGGVEFGGDSTFYDTLTFTTTPTLFGFKPLKQFKAFASAEDTTTIEFAHPLGTYIYGLDPDSNALTVYEPEAVYEDERSSRRIPYLLDDVPEGISHWYFWAELDGDTTTHYKVTVHRAALVNGRAKGVITR